MRRWHFFFLVGFLALPCAASETNRSLTKRVVILGDSLTAGYGIPKDAAYPALLQKKVGEAKLPWRISNGGRSGDTTRDGVTRLNWLLKQRADIFVVALGGNDGLRGIDPKSTKANLLKIIAQVREKYPKAKIMIAGMQMPDNLGKDYTEAFAAVYPAVAKETKATLVPFLLEGVAGETKFNQDDQIHPNEAGHEILAETMWKALKPLMNGEESKRERP